MPTATPTRPNLHEYSKHLIRRWERQGRTLVALAAKTGFSVGFFSQVKSDRTHMGLEPLRALGALFGLKLGELEDSAAAWERAGRPDEDSKQPVSGHTIAREDRYPNRAIAAAWARQSGEISNDVVEEVLGYALESENDLPPLQWLHMMEHEQRRQRFRQRAPVQAAREDAVAAERAVARLKEVAKEPTFEERLKKVAKRRKPTRR